MLQVGTLFVARVPKTSPNFSLFTNFAFSKIPGQYLRPKKAYADLYVDGLKYSTIGTKSGSKVNAEHPKSHFT